MLRNLADLDADHSLAWEHLDSETLVLASRRSFNGDNLPLRELIGRMVDPASR